MSTITKQAKRDYSKTNIKASLKYALKNLIIKDGYSVFSAASKYDMEESHANNILFDKKPTDKQFAHAFEIYDKGFSLTMACVVSGVSPEAFKSARRAKENKQYRPARW